MNKFFPRLLITLTVLFAVWFALSRVPFIETFGIQQLGKATNENLGDAIMTTVELQSPVISSDSAEVVMNELFRKLCEPNRVNYAKYKVHICRSSEVNAFAIPGDHIVVYSGLIDFCDSPEELMGVLAHELAHAELGHLKSKMWKESVIAILSNATGGSVAAGTIGEMVSKSFDRQQEEEADKQGMAYLRTAKINPIGFAALFRKMDGLESISLPDFMSTHPDCISRAEAIERECAQWENNFEPLLSSAKWRSLKKAIS
jgi:predicted Zn-dependent protease